MIGREQVDEANPTNRSSHRHNLLHLSALHISSIIMKSSIITVLLAAIMSSATAELKVLEVSTAEGGNAKPLYDDVIVDAVYASSYSCYSGEKDTCYTGSCGAFAVVRIQNMIFNIFPSHMFLFSL
jgi:hypothetical protein